MSSTGRSSSSTSDLWDFVVDLDWPKVIQHAKEFPNDAEWTDGHWHETPLYSACQSNPPLDVIQAIIAAYPHALLCPTRGNKDLPIHIACRYQCSQSILEELLLWNPATAIEQTRWGKTPIMALWEFRSKGPPNDHHRDGQNILTYMDDDTWEKVLIILKAVARFREESTLYQDDNNVIEQQPRKKRLRKMVVKNNKNTTEDEIIDESICGSNEHIVHAAVSLGSLGCPLPVLVRTIHSFPDQVYQRDHNGELPLHLAVGPTDWNPSTRRQYMPREQDIISLLLTTYPEAASVSNQNDHGRYPLHSAISNRHTWNGGVECLFRAAPEVVLMRDPVTKLFPFQLAAVPIRDSKVDLETVYMLLRSQPDVLTLMDCFQARQTEKEIQPEGLLLLPTAMKRTLVLSHGMYDLLLGFLTAISIGSLSGMVFGSSSY